MFLGSFHMLERSKCSVRNNFPSFNGTTTKLSWLQNCCLLTETARRARKVCLWWWVKNTSYTHPDTFPQFSQPKKTLFQMFRYVFSFSVNLHCSHSLCGERMFFPDLFLVRECSNSQGCGQMSSSCSYISSSSSSSSNVSQPTLPQLQAFPGGVFLLFLF